MAFKDDGDELKRTIGFSSVSDPDHPVRVQAQRFLRCADGQAAKVDEAAAGGEKNLKNLRTSRSSKSGLLGRLSEL